MAQKKPDNVTPANARYSGPLSQDLLAGGRLAVSAVAGITSIVESLHQSILNMGGLIGTSQHQASKGIPGLVYRSIHKVNTMVGTGLDWQLAKLGSALEDNKSSSGREAAIAALNGVLGDHLVSKGNPLAISMQFRRAGTPLSPQQLRDIIDQSNQRLIILVHGLCMNDIQWHSQGHNHGEALADELGTAAIYLHYNTGRHISENGRQFAALMESLSTLSHRPVEYIIIGHSMGGLVSRSAHHYANQAGHSWINHLQKLVFLGSPHHGAPLEKGGNYVDTLLKISPYSAAFAPLAKLRSSGITDLRFGNLLDEDWLGVDRFEATTDRRTPLPLPTNTNCYTLASSTSKTSHKLGDELIGDGLVTLSSALGKHKSPEHCLQFPKEHQWIGRNISHLDLLHHAEVYQTIKDWLEE